MLTKNDLSAIGKIIDEKLDQKLDGQLGKFEKKLDQKFDDKLGKFETKLDKKIDQKFKTFETKLDRKFKPIYEFIEFARPAIIALLDESQINFKEHLPKRVKCLEDIHPQILHHVS